MSFWRRLIHSSAFYPIACITVLALLSLPVRYFFVDGYLDQGPYLYQILILTGINIILAVSLTLINGIAGQFSIGHAGFFATGAYVSAFITVTLGPHWHRWFSSATPVSSWLSDSGLLLFGTLGAALATALAGLLVGIPSLRLRGDYLAIVTLGFGEIIRVLILNIDAVGGARGFVGIPKLSTFFWVFFFVITTISTVYNVLHSSYGRAFLAIREDEIAAQAMGVDLTRHKVMAFVISSIFAGVAGSLFAHHTMYLHPNTFTFIKSFEIIIMITIGGLGSIEGAVLGAILLTILPEAFRGFDSFRMVIYALVLILIMIYRPQGILGRFTLWNKRRRKAP